MRYYVIQLHCSRQGWRDFPELVSRLSPYPPYERVKIRAEEWVFKKENEAKVEAKKYTQETGRVTRVLRKPHGWEPPFLA